MNHIVARASIAYRANEVALDHTDTDPDEAVQQDTEEHETAQPARSPPSQRELRPIQSSKSLKNLRTAAAHTVNLRDCGSISNLLRQGRMFRSSQVMRYGRRRKSLFSVLSKLIFGIKFATASAFANWNSVCVAVQQRSQNWESRSVTVLHSSIWAGP